MRVIGVRQSAERSTEGAKLTYGFEELDGALRQADFVVLAVPVTAKTNRLMNATRLALLQPHAYLINVGRGVLIDEPALIEALRARSFAGAALDVTTEEPLPSDSPLWTIDNVLITPHIAGLTDRMWERHYETFTANLRRFLEDEPLRWIVDKQEEY